VQVGNRRVSETSYSLKEDGTVAAFLLALAGLYFLPVLIKGDSQVLSSVGADIWTAYYYWRHFGFESLAQGDIPLWNPYSFSGIPFVAGMESAIFYPLNFIYLLFGTAFSINLSLALHCFFASLFTYLYARYMGVSCAGSVLSSITYAYSAPTFLRIYAGHVVGYAALAWLPLLFMSTEAFLRNKEMRYALAGGIVLCLQFLAGQPQYLFYGMIAVSLYFVSNLLARRELREAPYFIAGFCLLVITGLSLSAVQLLPSLELTQHSVRNALGYGWVSSFSLPPENVITMLLPDFFGDLSTVPYWGKNYLWEMSIYLGLIPLVMGVAAIAFDRSRPVSVFAFIAAVALVLALGKHTPLLRFLYDYLPGFNLFRGLSKFIFVFSFACSMLAGYGLTQVAARSEAKDPGLRYLAYGISALALLLVGIGALGIFTATDSQELWNSWVKGYDRGVDDYLATDLTNDFFPASLRIVSQGLLKTAAILLLFSGSLLVIQLRNLPAKVLIAMVLALTVVDLWSFGSRYLVSFNPQSLYMDRDLRAFLKSDKESYRIATPLHGLLNIGLLESTQDVGGYDQLTLRNYNEFINFSQGLPVDQPNFVMVVNRFSPLLRLLNVKYYVLESTVSLELPDFRLVFQNGKYKVYRDGKALPRSFVVHDVRVITGRDAALQAMASPAFNPTSVAIVNEAVTGLLSGPALRSSAPRVVEDSPKKVHVEADLKQAGLLVLADVYYPGWKAFVDGREARIYRVNHAMRGVFLSSGRHVAEFRYDPLSFKIGALISLASLVLIVGYLVVGRFKFNSARFRRE
jgi:hypothetical protein